jgi:lipopolysaccharide/colanic/teichoic acid biosynthesis glycosyltransferase
VTAKRLFDIFSAFSGLLICGALILSCVILATFDTKSFGLFCQQRIGRYGKAFIIFKIKTLNDSSKKPSRFGIFLRKTKIDELPQLINILNGSMSFVGPRPDVSGYADHLTGADALILNIRPGVTGLASLKYRNEEQILVLQQNPLQYNDTIIWPDKVRINKWYTQNHTAIMDFRIIYYTLIPIYFDVDNFIDNYKSL